jgi:hypothetical protein
MAPAFKRIRYAFGNKKTLIALLAANYGLSGKNLQFVLYVIYIMLKFFQELSRYINLPLKEF